MHLFSTVGASDSATNWNTVTQSGLFPKLLGKGNPNSPNADEYFYCFVFKHNIGSDVLTQIAIPYSTGQINTHFYFRTLNVTWSAWSGLDNTVSSGTFTSGSGSLSTNIVRRSGNIVNFTLVNTNCNIPYGTSFGTFPVGFRPSGNQNIMCSGYITTTSGTTNFCPIMTIEHNGAIKQGVSSQITVKSYLISGTFIV